MNLNVITGNEDKLREFSEFIPGLGQIDLQEDIPEILSQDEVLVSLYKTRDMANALDRAVNFFSEDTSLRIQGFSVGTNIKHVMKNLEQYKNSRATWVVTIGLYENGLIKIFQSKITGVILAEPQGDSSFGFDNYFLPDCSGGETLAQLDAKQMKYLFSARANAVKDIVMGRPYRIFKIDDIPDWTKGYQEEQD